MKRIHKILTVLICSGILTPCHAAESSRYNIVLLFADDISAREFPVYESTVWTPPWAFGNDTSEQRFRAETPVINKLAHEGAFVRTAWANAVCSPSRATIMTGRYGHLHKWWQNNDVGKHRDENGKLVDWPIYMSSPLTLAQVAKQGGYNTYWTGKTQMKVSDEELQNFGFDCILNTPGAPANSPTDFYYYQGIDPQSGTKAWLSKDTGLPPAWKAGNQMVWSETSFFWQPAVSYMSYENSKWRVQGWPISRQDRENYGLHTFGPDVELEYSFKFIERSVNEGKPFFIYHTSHLGHGAHNYLRQKSLKGNERVYYPGTPKISWDGSQYHRTEPKITGDMGEYDTHGTVTEPGIHHHINYLDYQVWQYMEKLEELGIKRNTIFILTADNGTTGYGKMRVKKQQGPHVPFVIYIPGMKRHGEQNILMDITDILPTIADVAGVEIPQDYEINGKSLLPYFMGQVPDHREWIYSFLYERQLIRGKFVLRDGYGDWWDISNNPADLDSFPQITDWNSVPETHRKERMVLEGILPGFDKHATEHGAPGTRYPIKNLSERLDRNR